MSRAGLLPIRWGNAWPVVQVPQEIEEMQIIWDDSYRLGLPEIDSQHKKFVHLLRDMNDRYAGQTDTAAGKEANMSVYLDILKLREYAFTHFATEERWMIKYKYPNFFEHKKEHDQFIKKVFELEDRLLEAETVITAEMLEFIGTWFEHHLNRIDRQFGKYLKYSGYLGS